MMLKRTSTALAVVALVVATAFAQDGFILKRTAKVGDTTKYKMSADLNFQGQELKITATVNEKVTKVEDGKFTVETEQTEMQLNGQEVPAEEQKSTATYTLSGKLVETSSTESGDDGLRLSALQGFIYPEKELKVGDTGSWAFKANESKNPRAIAASYKVEAREKVGAWDTAKISFEVKETEGDEPASAKGTIWFDVKDGQMVKYEGVWTNAPFPMIGAITATMKLERQ